MLRSTLTVLGVVIGIVFIVALLSLSEGLKNSIVNLMGVMGTDVLLITPGKEGTPIGSAIISGITFNSENLRTVRQTEGVKAAYPMSTNSFTFEYGSEKQAVSVSGIPREAIELFEATHGFYLESGRWFEEGRSEVVLGGKLAKKVFDKEISVGSKIHLDGKKFVVVGVLKEMGTTDDYEATTSYTTMGDLTGKEKMLIIAAQTYPGADMDATAAKIKKKLEEERGVEDFAVMTNKKVLETVNSVLSLIELFLTSIAAVALVVGAVGIMNTIYMSVYERTREIGVMKAIGATNLDIIMIFVIESGIIGLAGGVAGLIIGFVFAKNIEYIAIESGFRFLKASITPLFMLEVLAFSFIIGVVAGILPAKAAADLKPAEALRYE